MTVRAIVFDMDGVLVDAKGIHRSSFRRACAAHGFDITKSDADLEGLPTRVKLRLLGATTELEEKIFQAKQQYTMDAAADYPFDLKLNHLVSELACSGLKLACVTNSIRATAERFLTNAGVRGFLKELITNEDVQYSKPHPEGYLLAMSRLGVTPRETVILEDSDVGVAAALKSGALVLRVPDVDAVRDLL